MTFYAVAVGQGDSCIIQCPNKQDIVIIDMGAKGPQYVGADYLTHLLKERFNAGESGMRIHLVVSHPHIDHYTFVKSALDDPALLPNLQQVILGGEFAGYGKTLTTWLTEKVDRVYTINDAQKCFGNTNCTLTDPRTGAVLRNTGGDGVGSGADPWQLCSSSSVKFTVLGANIGTTENGQSVILKIAYGTSWSFLTSGDFEMVTPQQELMEKWTQNTLKSTYYKVAHHGAWTDKKPNIPDLLQLIQPEKVYISQGYPSLSKFHHPNVQTYQNLIALDSIVKIPPSSNKPFVYWDDDSVVLSQGLDRAIYETCRQFDPNTQVEVCQDIVIVTDGRQDNTTYVDVPDSYVKKRA